MQRSVVVVLVLSTLVMGSLSWTPPTYNSTVYNAFFNKTLLNPLPPLTSDPYNDPTFNTTWVNTVCAVRYPSPENRSFYYLENYENPAAAQAAGAYVTHLHPCGQCSTTRDLAVYMKYPDLTEPVRICALESLLNNTWALECLERIGFSYECSVTWLYDAENTRKDCFGICMYDLIMNVTNNVPPNSTILNPCIQCDEDKSGPIFKVVAGRTRRDSGLLSNINRPPQDIYEVTHYYY